MRTASRPALRPPPMPTVATGTPAGICTIDSRLSRPSRRSSGARDADDRQRRGRGDHAGQVGRSPGAGDDHPQAAAGGGLGVVEHPARRPVGGDDVRLVGHVELLQRLARPAPSPASRSRCP